MDVYRKASYHCIANLFKYKHMNVMMDTYTCMPVYGRVLHIISQRIEYFENIRFHNKFIDTAYVVFVGFIRERQWFT